MPTQSEQKALAFVAIVILVAGAARVVRAGALGSSEPSPVEQQGLARQAFAANSAAVEQRATKAARPAKTRKARLVAPAVTPGQASSAIRPLDLSTSRLGFPPPGPRIDIGSRRDTSSAPGTVSRRKKAPSAAKAAGPVDLDTATEQEIEALPRVGPALAKRIVANRDSLGPFRSLDGLRRVRGIGPATAALLQPLVTFSRQTRP